MTFLQKFSLSDQHSEIIAFFKRLNPSRPAQLTGRKVLIDAHPNIGTITKNLAIAYIHYKRGDEVFLYIPITDRQFYKRVLRFYLWRFITANRVYRTTGLFKDILLVNPFKEILNLKKSLKELKSITSKEKMLSVKFGPTPLGDLIYDNYLVENKVPTLNVTDKWKIITLLNRAFNVKTFSKKHLQNNITDLKFTHASYLEFGIIIRTLLNAERYLTQSQINRFMRKLNKTDYKKKGDNYRYPIIFSSLSDQAQKIQQGLELLDARLEGAVDDGIKYMKKSVYSDIHIDDTANIEFGSRSLVFMLHDFFDSPHNYSWSLFADFWEWMDQSLSSIDFSKNQVLLKPHPRMIAGNEQVIQQLKLKYPKIHVLPAGTSNKFLATQKNTYLVTVHGTIAHEVARLGGKVIMCGDNPQAAYNFAFLAATKKEYFDALQSPHLVPFDTSHDQVGEFMYMHFLHDFDGKLPANFDPLNVYELERIRNCSPSLFDPETVLTDHNITKTEQLFNAIEEQYRVEAL
jgi:hypothetical protein